MNIDTTRSILMNEKILTLNPNNSYPMKKDLGLFGEGENQCRLFYVVDTIGTTVLNDQTINQYQTSYEAVSPVTGQPIPNSSVSVAGTYKRPAEPLTKAQLKKLKAELHASYRAEINKTEHSFSLSIIANLRAGGHKHSTDAKEGAGKDGKTKGVALTVKDLRSKDHGRAKPKSEESKTAKEESKSSVDTTSSDFISIFAKENAGKTKLPPEEIPSKLDDSTVPMNQAVLAALIRKKIVELKSYETEKTTAKNNIMAFNTKLNLATSRHLLHLARLADCGDKEISEGVLVALIDKLRKYPCLSGDLLIALAYALKFPDLEIKNLHNLINGILVIADEKCKTFLNDTSDSAELADILNGLNGIIEAANAKGVTNVSFLTTQKDLYKFYKAKRKDLHWSQRVRYFAARGMQGLVRLGVDVSAKQQGRLIMKERLKGLLHVGEAIYTTSASAALTAYQEYRTAVSLKQEKHEGWYDELIELEELSRTDWQEFGKQFLGIAKDYILNPNLHRLSEDSEDSTRKSSEDSISSTPKSSVSHKSSEDSVVSTPKSSSSHKSSEDSLEDSAHLSSSHYLLSGILELLSNTTTFDVDPKNQRAALAVLAEFLTSAEDDPADCSPAVNALKILFAELHEKTQDSVSIELVLRFWEWTRSSDSEIQPIAKSSLGNILGAKPRWLGELNGLTKAQVAKVVAPPTVQEAQRRNTLMNLANEIEVDIDEAVRKVKDFETNESVNLALKSRMERFVLPEIVDANGKRVDPMSIVKFLKSTDSKKVVIIQGASGVGKSTLMQYLYDVEMIELKIIPRAMAGFINLGSEVSKKSIAPLEEAYKIRCGKLLSAKQVENMCSSRDWTHTIFEDSWDEMGKNAKNAFALLPLKQISPQSKVVMALRNQDVTFCEDTHHLLVPIEDGRIDPSQVEVYTIRPFSEDKIREWITKANKKPTAPWKIKVLDKKTGLATQPYDKFKDPEEYMSVLKTYGLIEMASNALRLDRLYLTLPLLYATLKDKQALVTLELEMYKELKKIWYKREETKRAENGEIIIPGEALVLDAEEFDKMAASLMYRNNWQSLIRPKKESKFKPKSNDALNLLFSKDNAGVLRASFLQGEESETGKSQADETEGRKFSFGQEERHYFFVFLNMQEEVMSSIKLDSLFNFKSITNESLFKFLAMEAFSNAKFKQKLEETSNKALGPLAIAAINARAVLSRLDQLSAKKEESKRSD